VPGTVFSLQEKGARICENWLINWKTSINLCILYKRKLVNRLLIYRGIPVKGLFNLLSDMWNLVHSKKREVQVLKLEGCNVTKIFCHLSLPCHMVMRLINIYIYIYIYYYELEFKLLPNGKTAVGTGSFLYFSHMVWDFRFLSRAVIT
jgi:hypothetical protein